MQVGSSAQVAQEAFNYVGLQAAVESFFLSEAEDSIQHFNALVALLVAERGLGLPDSLARPSPMQLLCSPCIGEPCETLLHTTQPTQCQSSRKLWTSFEFRVPLLQEGAKALLGQKYAQFKASQLTTQAAASTPNSGIQGAVVSTKAGWNG